MVTTPIENLLSAVPDEGVTMHRHYRQYAALCVARANLGILARGSAPFLTERLGRRWDYTFTGEFRSRVWETPTWRIFVSNRGWDFEVLPEATVAEAQAAWEDFLTKAGFAAVITAADGPTMRRAS
jgi:hypothetical protein